MDTERVTIEDTEYHTRTPRYYRCSNCANEQNKKCLAKPGNKNIKLNKKRNHCKKFKFDEEKFETANRRHRPIPIERRPDWYWLTRQQRKRLAELMQGALVVPPSTAAPEERIIAPPHSEKLIWTPGDALDDET